MDANFLPFRRFPSIGRLFPDVLEMGIFGHTWPFQIPSGSFLLWAPLKPFWLWLGFGEPTLLGMVRPPPCFAVHVALSVLVHPKFHFSFSKAFLLLNLWMEKKNMKQESLFQECSPEAVRKAADAGHLTKFKSFQSVCWISWSEDLWSFLPSFGRKCAKFFLDQPMMHRLFPTHCRWEVPKYCAIPFLDASCIGRSNWLMTSFSMLWRTMRKGGQCANWQSISTNASLQVVPCHGAWEGLAQTCTSPTWSCWHVFFPACLLGEGS